MKCPLILAVVAALRGGSPLRTRPNSFRPRHRLRSFLLSRPRLRWPRPGRPTRPRRQRRLPIPRPTATSQRRYKHSATNQYAATGSAGRGSAEIERAPRRTSTAPPEKTGAGGNPDDEVTVIRKRVNEVNVVFTVTDKRGHFVKDLTKDDFRVYDDNKPAESIRSFNRETDLPLRVGLLIDASNSVRDRFKFEQESAIEFLNQIIRRTSDKAFVIGFDTTPEVTQDMTDDTQALSKGVRMLRPGGGTAMYDAIYYAARDKLMQGQEHRADAARHHPAERRRRQPEPRFPRRSGGDGATRRGHHLRHLDQYQRS